MRVLSLLLALASILFVESQSTTFVEVQPTGNQWSPRAKANVEFITGSKTVRSYDDGTGRTTSVSLTNYFLLYGGQGPDGGLNDVWVGNSAGTRWYFVAGAIGDFRHPIYRDTFTPAVENGHAQDSTGRQYRAGGIVNGPSGNTMINEVWSSVDGINWGGDPVTEFAEWSPRYFPNLVCDSRDRLYLAGGITSLSGDPRDSSNEVWRSTNHGQTWDEISTGDSDNGPVGRGVAILLSSGSVWGTDPVLLWMTGVNTAQLNPSSENVAYLADVWATRNSGRSWSAVTLAATFGRRDDANAEITNNGLIVLAGGYAGTQTREVYNDVWVSANGGYSWGQCVADAEWEDRRYLMTVLDNNGILWVMGGDANGLQSDIWKSTWSLNDNNAVAQRCGISIPSCGVGLKCWPGESTTLVSTDGSNVYCNSCPYSFGNSTASTLVVVFLVIFLIGFIISLGLLGYTYHKLRSAGAPSPIPLPASAQAWWNKSTASAVNGTTDSATTGGADQIYQPLRIRDQV